MAVYGIISLRAERSLIAALEQHYSGKVYQWSDRFAAITTADAPKAIAVKLGVKNRTADGTVVDGISDVIITKLAPNYYGWGGKGFWDWLKVAHQEAGD